MSLWGVSPSHDDKAGPVLKSTHIRSDLRDTRYVVISSIPSIEVRSTPQMRFGSVSSPGVAGCRWASSPFPSSSLGSPPAHLRLGGDAQRSCWQARQITLQLPVAFLRLPVREVVTVDRLLQFKQHVFSPALPGCAPFFPARPDR